MNSNTEFNTIAQVNLDPIKVKLMHKESGEGWSLEQATEVEFEYRRFLCLMKLFPHEQMAPLFDIDIFWHYHILDTMKYAADCEHIFGYFLHHFPYVGLRGADDEAAHHRVGIRMQELYEATFGDAYIRQQKSQPSTTAYSITAYQNDLSLLNGQVARPAMTAYSLAVGQNDRQLSVRLMSGSAKTAYSLAVGLAQNDAVYSVRPVAETAKTAKTAYSLAVAQNDPFYSVRPMLAQAA